MSSSKLNFCTIHYLYIHVLALVSIENWAEGILGLTCGRRIFDFSTSYGRVKVIVIFMIMVVTDDGMWMDTTVFKAMEFISESQREEVLVLLSSNYFLVENPVRI